MGEYAAVCRGAFVSRLSTKQRRARKRWAPRPGYRILAEYHSPEDGRLLRVVAPEAWFTREGWRKACDEFLTRNIAL